MERRLGKGLGTLLQTPTDTESVGHIELALITPNPFQPRKTMDPVGLEELRDSIRVHGVLQPIVVRKFEGAFQLVSGERRWRAARLAGLDRIPAVVRPDVSDAEMLELALVENVQRRDLNPLERAEGFKGLIDQLGLTQEAVATKLGLKRSTIANHLRLLDLPEEARNAVARGLISMGHARAMLGLPEPGQIVGLLERTVRDDLSVREVERQVRDAVAQGNTVARESLKNAVPAWIGAVERRLREALATKVSVEATADGRGSITIDFYTPNDLDRILDRIAPQATV